MGSGNQTLKTVEVVKILRGVCKKITEVEIVGCWDNDTPEDDFSFYDLYVDDKCINEGEPCYTYPTEEDIKAFLEIRNM